MDKRDEQAIDAVRLYYERGFSQAKVASKMGISHLTATKLLQRGKEAGFVTIGIHDPCEKSSLLATRLEERFVLKHTRVVHPVASNERELLEGLGRAGAGLVGSLVRDGMSVGVSWGRTMDAIASHLRPTVHRDVEIVQPKGGTSHSDRVTNDFGTTRAFCTIFNASARYLSLPVISDDVRTLRIMESDRHIAQTLEAGRRTDLVVFTVGALAREALVFNPGHFHEEEITRLLERSMEDACSCFFTASGKVAVPRIDARAAGVSLVDPASRPIRILITGGPKKVVALRTAIRMGSATHVVVDQDLTLTLLLEDEARDWSGAGSVEAEVRTGNELRLRVEMGEEQIFLAVSLRLRTEQMSIC